MKLKSLVDLNAVRQYLNRIGAEPRSIKTAVVKEHRGNYWKDLAIIRFHRDGNVVASVESFAPTEAEAAAIRAELLGVEWPEIAPLARIINPPKEVQEAGKENVFEFRDESGMIRMLQVRTTRKGEKAYVPYTYWDDGEWRCMEPDGQLPLYNAHLLKDAATIFLHEGAKAAAYVQWMCNGETREARDALNAHPWGSELRNAVHLGWIGGALSPERTDWEAITRNGIKRAYIVADNDDPGRMAVPAISEKLRIPTYCVQFTDEFPPSFDLADKFPDEMFGSAAQFYIGPTFRDCLHPATWATDLVPTPKGKPRPVLRDSFRNTWAYVEEADLFVCLEMPEIMRTEAILNKMLAAFSHVAETSRLIVKAYKGRSTRVCYRPDVVGRSVTFRGSSAINLHVPCNIKPLDGDVAPWLDFLAYLFVHPEERRQVERWCATLIAKPGTRMAYGLLLISEKQGVGKTTLGSHILAPLVGIWNVGFPGETDITSSFNDWVAHKRLAIIGEIYSGNSWKSYNTLKSIITDRDITVNAKYQRQYVIENWCHVLACSNSMRALKMENDDRRWHYPEVTEIPWSRTKFSALRKWIDGGGLSLIRRWAEEYEDYVEPSERAPMTERKKELIEGSRSEAQQEAAALAEAVRDHPDPVAVILKDVVGWCRQNAQGRVYDSDYELKRSMVEVGLSALPKRLKIGARLEYVLVNDRLKDIFQRTEEDQFGEVRKHVKRCNDLMERPM